MVFVYIVYEYMLMYSYTHVQINYKLGGKILIDIFKALSEESRLRILSVLLTRQMCVCEIEESLDLTQSNASRHLKVLKECGILDSEKKAQWAYYSISENFKNEHSDLWNYLQVKLKELSTYEKDYSESEKCKLQEICN